MGAADGLHWFKQRLRELSFSVRSMTCFPFPTWHTQATVRSVGDGRSGATRSKGSRARPGLFHEN